MGYSKRSIKNKARVEGSICASYLHRETTRSTCYHHAIGGMKLNVKEMCQCFLVFNNKIDMQGENLFIG